MRLSRQLLASAMLAMAAMANIQMAWADPLTSCRGEAVAVQDPVATARAQAAPTYGQLPLSFTANQGQTDGRVKFVSRGGGFNVFLTSTEAVMVLEPPRREPSQLRLRPATTPVARTEVPEPRHATVVRMRLIGSNPTPRVTGLDELPGKANYFLGSDPARWYTNIPTYAKVKYDNVYPGVDQVYYGNQRQLEYDLIIAPCVDPRIITLAFEGSDRLEIDAEGDLVLQTPVGAIRQRKPVIYQEVDGARKPVPGRYVLKSRQQVGFELAAYDVKRPLVVDPTLVYSTYVGSAGSYIAGSAIAVDAFGQAFITGQTTSFDFPSTGCISCSSGGVFVTKLNADGSNVIYSTLFGNAFNLDPEFVSRPAIAIDQFGNAYVTGSIVRGGLPTTPDAFQKNPASGSGPTAFVTKLSFDGAQLLYSTYLGGNGIGDLGFGIAVDTAGQAYVTGYTTATNFPTTLGAFQTRAPGPGNAFVTKLNAAGSLPIFSTYLGGSGDDLAGSIVVDATGHAYVAGGTSSANFPTTQGSYQTVRKAKNPAVPGSPAYDVFVTKLQPDGRSLVYSTYLSGTGDQFGGEGLAVDAAGNAYVTGWTTSTDFPTVNALQPTFPSPGSSGLQYSPFVTKVSPDGSGLVYSTYLGAPGSADGNGPRAVGFAITLDSSRNIYVAGRSEPQAFPVTQGAFQTRPGAGTGTDAFVVKLDSTGVVLVYSSFLGGVGGDIAYGMAVDALGNVFVTGQAGIGFPTTPGALQTSFQGTTSDFFVAKFNLRDTVLRLQFVDFPATLPALPKGTVGVPYAGNIGIGGGKPPYRVTQLSAFPPGLSFKVTPASGDDAGVPSAESLSDITPLPGPPPVGGTPTQCGTSLVSVIVSDGSNGSLSGFVPLSIQDATGHGQTIPSPPAGSPNPVASEQTTTVSAEVVDSQGHPLSYTWTATCPTLPSAGTFSNANARNPTWTAPINTTGAVQSCTLSVTATDGVCLSQASFSEQVIPAEARASGRLLPGLPADYDADGRTDIAVYRSSIGTWFIINSSTGAVRSQQWGAAGDIPVPGDYDGDRKSDITAYRPSNGMWFVIQSSTGTVRAMQWGASGDVPMPGDYDGDGETDVAVYRPSTGVWFIINSHDGSVTSQQWGVGADRPVPGDYDGDGRTDIAVYRPSTGVWFIINSRTGTVTSQQWGASEDIPVPGDYDGDGRTDIAVYRPSTGVWFIINSSTGIVTSQQWGASEDIPVPGKYDGDGKTDIAVYRPSTGVWFIIRSSDGVVAQQQWGAGGDQPLPGWF